MLKYVLPVLLGSVVFSLPKYFEATVEWRTHSKTNETYPAIRHTEFRVDSTYSR